MVSIGTHLTSIGCKSSGKKHSLNSSLLKWVGGRVAFSGRQGAHFITEKLHRDEKEQRTLSWF